MGTETVYFGVRKTEKFYLDDAKTQWIEYKKLNEGERIQFEDSVNSSFKMNQETKDVTMNIRTGSDRAALVKLSVCGYSILVGNEGTRDEAYTKEGWEKLYAQMDSDLAEKLYQEILTFNGFKKKSEVTQPAA